LEHEDTRTGFDNKYDAEFESAPEEEKRKIATLICAGFFECVEGMVLDSWVVHKEAEGQAKRVLFNQSRDSRLVVEHSIDISRWFDN
jgi:hypothetical protein